MAPVTTTVMGSPPRRRGLVRDGLLTRTQQPGIPPRVDYALTPLGKDLAAALDGWSVTGGSMHRAARQQQPRYDEGGRDGEPGRESLAE